ncbi:MAG: peptidylprolyl isomerase [Ignavibacteriales bacterium]|nr:peptidylprolyl isomerase [Ignavibacteriales bacterium]
MNKFSIKIFLLFNFLFTSLTIAQPEVADRIVAVVGKEPILLSDLNAQIELYTFTNRVDANTPGLKEQVLDALINEKLILSKALEDTNITVTDDEVNNELDAQIAQRIQQLGSEKRVEEAFGMPIARLKREYRDGMRKQIMTAKLWEMKKLNITISRREVEEFYEQYKDSLPWVPEEVELYHIFKVPKVSESTKNSMKQQADKILDTLRAGGDFADFASRYSDDLGTKSAGGDLGFVRRGEFFAEFEEAVFSLQLDQFSDVIETPIGFHIIQLIERRGEQVHPRHILFKFKRDASEADSTIAFLKELKDSVKQGAIFSDIAKRHSDDKESASLGGYIGRLPVTQFDKSLLEAIKDIEEGEISEPVEFVAEKSRGYQIILLKKRIPEHAMSLTDDWTRLEQLALSYKRNTEYQNWIGQLRSEIYWDARL